MTITSRDLLIYKAVIYDGDYQKIYHSIDSHEEHNHEHVREVVNSLKCKVITIIDDDYPQYLLSYRNPPIVLFYYGDITLINDYHSNLAVVGSRVTTKYGVNATKDLLKDVVAEYNIVSGLAKGIDSVAHEFAVCNKGKTIAVLGCGIDNCYPAENIFLKNNILKTGGLIISEYPNLSEPHSTHFPMRNRLISYFAKAILITEAKKKSGTLITVSWGLNFSRDIMCVPYPYNVESACNDLIKNGASLVENSHDVLDIMGNVKN